MNLGWRTRPSDKLLIELSLYHYVPKNAVFSGPPKYDTSDVKTTGGELTFDYRASRSWHLQGGIPIRSGKKEGVKQDDFPESMANLSSHLNLRDDLTFIQSLYYTGDRTDPILPTTQFRSTIIYAWIWVLFGRLKTIGKLACSGVTF